MTLKELVYAGIIRDADWIKISKPVPGIMPGTRTADTRRGQWFSDRILPWTESEIKELSWERGKGFTIMLEADDEVSQEEIA